MIFYLGTHKAHWLRNVSFPLFLSVRTLKSVKKLYPATCDWALDSGGFTELSMLGRWETTAKEYYSEVRRYISEIGRLNFASIQDWMCESFILKKTGLTVLEHQEKTIDSFIELSSLDSSVPWLPVIQGYTLTEYLKHVEMYDKRGIKLASFPRVGVGSVCRREKTKEAESIITSLSNLGISLHGFGFKVSGLRKVADLLSSADSMAWSYNARISQPLDGCPHSSCANCLKWASDWRKKILFSIHNAHVKPRQMQFTF